MTRDRRHHRPAHGNPFVRAATRPGRGRRAVAATLVTLAATAAAATDAAADRITNRVAVFAGLDKITARITTFEVAIDDTRLFGALEVTPRACFTSPPTEPPKTTAFVEVDELLHDDAPQRIFTGWMFADSPGLHGVEHPVYDVWLTDCKEPTGTTTE